MVIERLASPMEPSAAVEQPTLAVRRRSRAAQRGAAGDACLAPTAGRNEREDDVIARRHAFDVGPDLLDDARGLVPEHHRQRPRPRAVDDREIGMADTRRLDPHQQLARLRLVELDLLDAERTRRGVWPIGADPLEDGGADLHRVRNPRIARLISSGRSSRAR